MEEIANNFFLLFSGRKTSIGHQYRASASAARWRARLPDATVKYLPEWTRFTLHRQTLTQSASVVSQK